MINLSNNVFLKWKRFKSEAKIPTKRFSDVGYDIYTIEDNVTLMPHSTHMFATGLGCKPPQNIWLHAVDRGSTGSRGIHTLSGIIDEQYTGEIFIALCNTTDKIIYFTSTVDKIIETETEIYYPISKGIAQIVPEWRFNSTSEEISDDEWNEFCGVSERGAGKLGASGK